MTAMYQIIVEDTFDAFHRLHLPEVQEPLHKHAWRVWTAVESPTLNRLGMVMDFRLLRQYLHEVLGEFSSLSCLNEHPYFQTINPSAEALAAYIYERLQGRLPDSVIMASVCVEEETGCRALYKKDNKDYNSLFNREL